VDDIEAMRRFYLKYFDLTSGEKYVSTSRDFTSYFLSFGEGTTRIELMASPDIQDTVGARGFTRGVCHFAISVGGKAAVDALTERLREDGYTIASKPRTTGDGYYESVVLDPEGNYVEISA
jgi:Lactoylglutathione lyase and related lyases